ncbi:MAG: FMN-binding protein [Vicinamibacterales bacterium]|nr:FMN-binding protein [Vicinamibacterales bacterium]
MRYRATTDPLRFALLAASLAVLVAVAAAPVFAQRWRATDDIPRYEDYLREALPGAETFRWINRGTPHYRGYKTGPNGEEELVGLGFFTVDFAPKVRGYKGQIWMLVGMDPGGTLVDISMVYHNEPFGYFSVDPARFLEQFRGKSVLAPMTVGEDIDAVSRATITNDSAVRAIRESARRMAREYIAERASEQ